MEILETIQEDLHDNDTEQLMTKTFNNLTEYIKFDVNPPNILSSHQFHQLSNLIIKRDVRSTHNQNNGVSIPS